MVFQTTATAVDQAVHNHKVCHEEWANRPASERFWTVRELREHMFDLYQESQEIRACNEVLAVDVIRDQDRADLALVLGNHVSSFTNWSFGQLATRLRVPGAYLRTLPPAKAADLINFELDRHRQQEGVLWVREGEPGKLLAFTSEHYGRIPSYLICDALLELPSQWRVPPARPVVDDPRVRLATEQDVLHGNRMGLSVEVGDPIAPAGVYGDDRSIFVFMVNEERAVEVSEHETLYRGFYLRTSDVGAYAISITMFDYSVICGNHVIWNCQNVREFRTVHRGEKESVHQRFLKVFGAVRAYADADTGKQRELVATARRVLLGKDKEETIRFVQEKDVLSQRNAERAWQLAEVYADIHGAPNTIWGYVSGITRLSQTSPYADVRDDLDRSVSRLLALTTGA